MEIISHPVQESVLGTKRAYPQERSVPTFQRMLESAKPFYRLPAARKGGRRCRWESRGEGEEVPGVGHSATGEESSALSHYCCGTSGDRNKARSLIGLWCRLC